MLDWGLGVAPQPGQAGHRVRRGADQVERVVGRQGVQVSSEFAKEARAYRCGAEREVSPAAAAGGVGEGATGVQQAGHARDAWMDGEPGAAGLLVDPTDQGRTWPVPGGRAPGAAGQFISDAKQAQWDGCAWLKADDDGTHM